MRRMTYYHDYTDAELDALTEIGAEYPDNIDTDGKPKQGRPSFLSAGLRRAVRVALHVWKHDPSLFDKISRG